MREWESTRIALKSATEGVELPGAALSVAKAVAQEKALSLEARRELISTVRAWTDYARENEVKENDLFSVRWHLEQFAQGHFNTKETTDLEILSAPIKSLELPSGESFKSYVQGIAGEGIFDDPNVAIFGGTSRTALKLYGAEQAHLDLESTQKLLDSELPLNDVDIILNKSAVTGDSRFTADLAGTRIVNDIQQDMQELLQNIDCTFNQSLIHEGKLYFTQEALNDAREGIVRFTDKEDALFGAEVEVLPDGKKYINRKGLYRAFAFLLRGKAEKFPIHKDNLASEIPHMGRYWVVLLMVKLLPMKDDVKRRKAASRWFNLAKKLEATTASTPREFLQELLVQHPEMQSLVAGRGKTSETKFDSQVRWLAGKLVDRAVDSATGQNQKPPLPGMSDDVVVIDESHFEGGGEGVEELLNYISGQKDASN